MRLWRQPQAIAAPGAMIGASNSFELAVSVVISLFDLNSGTALASLAITNRKRMPCPRF
ncbi:hypothetical protein [Synechococcus sp. CS-1328]|uniref:hypothetical protein n=1 Tax=Synechococcus sp. CS-1328 TaxID=2847976 RepID=UPI00223B2FF7|nr:hypothetical protein [Synechococcus sp. CS-1328]MCT0224819.1 hypothetical protein [Synechococcus sp. CS-1328]